MNRKTRIWAAITAALALTALVGCAPGGVSNGWGSADLEPVTVTLNDGRAVTCVALIGYSKGGLSCDWEGAK